MSVTITTLPFPINDEVMSNVEVGSEGVTVTNKIVHNNMQVGNLCEKELHKQVGSSFPSSVNCGNDKDELKTEKSNRCCIVCLSELDKEDAKQTEILNLSLFDFCHLLKVNFPSKSRTLLENFGTPLCKKCTDHVRKIKRIFLQIGELERDFIKTRRLMQQQIIATSNDAVNVEEDACNLVATSNAVNFVRRSLRQDISHKPWKTCRGALARKKSGRKPIRKLCNDGVASFLSEAGGSERKVQGKDLTFIPSHRSSFGRVVKRPRYLLKDGEDEEEKDETKKKYDLNQLHKPNTKVLPIFGNEPLVRKPNLTTTSNVSYKTQNQKTSLANKAVCHPHKRIKKLVNPLALAAPSHQIDFETKGQTEKSKPKPKILKKKRVTQILKFAVTNAVNSSSSVGDHAVLKDVDNQKQSTRKPKSEKKGSFVRVRCNSCIRSFTSLKKMEEHAKKFHEVYEDNLKSVAVTRNYECKHCQKKFTKLRDLVQHKKKDHPPKGMRVDEAGRTVFECEFCKREFRSPGDLQVHRRKHTGERPFKCETCNEGFISKGRYEVHVESSHPSVPPLKCEVCARSFFRHHRLRDHFYSHTGERPYQCEVCGKNFTQPSYLKYHQTKHKELNLAEFKCDQCEKSFASPVNLKFHTETQHQKKYRYHCSVCGHGASHVSHLKLHMRSHTGERPFSCSICDKTFTRGSQLKVHMRSHTGERPYACKTCSKGFTNSSKLKRHELTHVTNKSKRRKEIIKVTSLAGEPSQSEIQKNQGFSHVASAATTVIIPNMHEEINGQQFLKLEQVQASSTDGNEIQEQFFKIEQANGVYQLIATNDVINEPLTEYIVLNGEFQLA